MSKPRSEENGELLFQEPLQNHENPFNVNKVNPRHPNYGYYTSLINDLQAWDKYMDSVISDPEDNTVELKMIIDYSQSLSAVTNVI